MTFERIGVLVAGLSTLFFPWPLSVALALLVAIVEPLTPLVVGLFADILYYSPYQASFFPLYTVLGTLATAIAYFVRSRLKTNLR